MIDLTLYSLGFFVSFFLLLLLVAYGWQNRESGIGFPMLMVTGTTAVWYHGDAIYNDYEIYLDEMGADALAAGWWQVCLFLLAFLVLAPWVHSSLNQAMSRKRSALCGYLESAKADSPRFQARLDQLFPWMVLAWCMLMAAGLLRVNFDFIGLFAPYLKEKADPWGRGRLGGGFDAVFSLAGNIQILLVAGFGAVTALSRNPRTVRIGILILVLSLPYYIFDRTRSTMLAVLLPGMLSFVFIRLKAGLVTKAMILASLFALVSFWFSFVNVNRSDRSISSSFRAGQIVDSAKKSKKHEGISMFSELGYMNSFFEKGTLKPSWGQRYFAELVNPIPRALWKNKPTVGIDYSIARGFAIAGASVAGSAGVHATIASGMIGQGILNFGGILGPLTAAMLMAFWASILARMDLLGSDPARMLLFAVGLCLTFNMGRDITFLVLYPFVFGWILVLLKERFFPQGEDPRSQMPRPSPPPAMPGRGMRPLPPGPVRKEAGAVARRGGPPGRVAPRRIRG